jgi:hypothetical protein
VLPARSYQFAKFATPSQLLLLRGALCEPGEAAIAAEQWLKSDEAAGSGRLFEGLESGSRRLLPLLYHNVKGTLSTGLGERLKEVYLEYWASNQKTFRALETSLMWFQANHIPTLVLKGVALSLLHYPNSGLRPTCDADVLIPEEQASDVLNMLLREGWSSEYLSSSSKAPPSSSIFRNIHGLNLTRPGCGDLDVHWHVLHSSLFPDADRPFWNDSVALRVRSADTRALNPSDQLLHACVHGFARSVVAPIRWVADAVTVLRTSSVDWHRVLYIAGELRVTLPLGLTLSFLKECFQAEVPEDILEEFTASSSRREDRRYFDALDAVGTAQRRWSRIARYHYEKQRRIREGLHPLLRLALLPHDLGAFVLYRLRVRMNRRSSQA